MRRRTMLVLVVCMVVPACGIVTGLDGYGVVDDQDAATPPTSTLDGGRDSSPTPVNDSSVSPLQDAADSSLNDAKPVLDANRCVPDACVARVVPDGWTAARFSNNQTATCPAEFDRTIVQENPQPNGACSCGACTYSATCNKGSIRVRSAANPTCSNLGPNLNANDGGCYNLSNAYGLQQFSAFVPPNITTDSCSMAGAVDRSKVRTDARTLCTLASNACPESACADAEPGSEECIVHEGDLACPQDWNKKRVVGTDYSLSCSACGCSVNGTCTGTIALHDSTNCGLPVRSTATADDCNTEGTFTLRSTRWTGTISGTPTCQREGNDSQPTLDLTGKRTVCCK